VDLGEITVTDYIERESCGILFAILHLDFYVWSFYAFLFDSSTYTNSSLVSLPFIIGGRLLSQALASPQLSASATAHLSILACIGKVLACCLHQEHKRLPVVHNLCSELRLGTLLLLAPVVSLQYLVGSFGYFCTISVCPRAISVLQISPYSLLMFNSSSSCHNTYLSQNRVPICIPLLYFSSIIRVFINSPIEKLQSPNLISLEKSPLHQILKSDP